MFRFALIVLIFASACSPLKEVGRGPSMSTSTNGPEHMAMLSSQFPRSIDPLGPDGRASLWDSGRQSLLGDRRASLRGDILTVVIEIDDKAEISNSTSRSRSGSEKMAVPSLFGIPQRINEKLPEGASLDPAVEISSASDSEGDGSVRRKEKLTLRVAATITQVLQNGVLEVQGTQEVRVNYEIRELTVSGYVRPEDISRQNEITYDKIASARISYGGRGQISDVQQPRYGQQIADIILPF